MRHCCGIGAAALGWYLPICMGSGGTRATGTCTVVVKVVFGVVVAGSSVRRSIGPGGPESGLTLATASSGPASAKILEVMPTDSGVPWATPTVPPPGAAVGAAAPPVFAPPEEEESDHWAEEPLLPTVLGAANGFAIAVAMKACWGV